jgi:hypothetical protein
MSIGTRLLGSWSVAAPLLLASNAAFAGVLPPNNLPGPGVLALVAVGVVGAIVIARLRK